jgi:hypothetical protein
MIVDSLLRICNNKAFKGMCEPSVMRPLEVERWQVERVLKALKLLQEQYELSENTGE